MLFKTLAATRVDPLQRVTHHVLRDHIFTGTFGDASGTRALKGIIRA